MNKKFLYLINYRLAAILLILFASINVIYATSGALALQPSVATGQVVDVNGMGIPGVTITVKGTTNGTISDVEGNFSLSIDENSKTLMFTFIGMVTREVKINGNKPLLITMQEDAISMDELVVVGYGVQEKESLLSAIDQVSGENIEQMGASNVSAALSGISPGLLSMSTGGRPGDDASELYIRGRSSINDDQALVVVDGIKIEGGFEYMDPEEIASISILKDAAATAVYGVEGANGVVIVTTKRGHKGRARVSVNTDFTVKQPTSPIELMGSYDSQYLYNIAMANDNEWDKLTSDEALQHYADGDLPYQYPDVDWYNELVRDFAFSTRENVTVSGGTDLVSYFTTLGYSYEGDAFKPSDQALSYEPKNDFQKMTYRVNLDFNISPTTTFSTDFAGRFEKQNESGDYSNIVTNMFEYASWASPMYYPGNITDQYPDNDPFAPGYGEIRYTDNDEMLNTNNPYISLYGSGVTTNRRNVVTANFVLKQKLNFITKGLSVSGRYNLSANYLYKQKVSASPNLYSIDANGNWVAYDDAQQTKATLGNESASSKSDRYYYSVQLDYRRSFGNHNVSGLGLWSRSKYVSGSNFPDYKEDWVGRATYNYRKKYLIEFSGAYNGTDRFMPSKQFGFFPSGSVGWDMAKESFIKDNVPFLSQLKVRYSIGQSGSESESEKRMYFGTFVYADKGADYKNSDGTGDMYFGDNFGDQGGYLRESEVGNEDATWETATKQNLGVDFSLFKDRLSGSVELFNEHREDIFLDATSMIPDYYGSTASFKKANIGEVKKHGYEFSLNYSDVLANGLSYYVRLTYGFNENRILIASEADGTPDAKKTTGDPLGMNSVYLTNGYLDSRDDVLNSVTPSFGGDTWAAGDLRYVDYNGDGSIDSEGDQIYYGLPKLPSTNYGITIGCQYRNWSAKIFGAGIGSRHIVSSDNLIPFKGENALMVREENYDYWTPDNLDAAYPTLHATSTARARLTTNSTYSLIDSKYFRIKNVELAYNLNLSKNAMGLDRMKIFVSGYNLLTFSELEVGDPELSSPNVYPIMKRYTLGLRLDF